MISVIMSVYNNDRTVKSAIESVLNNGYNDLEFIIINDASTDNTAKILAEFAGDSRVKIITNEINIGLAGSLNIALTHTKGDYIARQDADDESIQGRFAAQIDFLKRKEDVDFVGCGAALVDENEKWGIRRFPTIVTKNDVIKYNPFIHPTLMFKKDAIMAIHGYRNIKRTIRCEDYDLIFRLYAANKKGENLPDILYLYYESQDSFNRHTFTTRYNEYFVKRHGAHLLKAGLKGQIFSLKPLALAFIPRKLYLKLHNNKWNNTK